MSEKPKSKSRNPEGRTPKEVDEALLEKLSIIHCSNQTIADCLGISVDTLKRRFAEKIEEFRSRGKAKLKTLAFNKAEKGDFAAIKFLLQNYTGMSDKVETKAVNTNTNMNYDNMTDEQLEQRLKELDGRRRNS